MPSNVRPFPRRTPSFPEESPVFGHRVLMALVYFLLTYYFSRSLEFQLLPLIVLGILAGAFIRHRRHSTPYFIRYNLLQAIILCAFLGLGFQIIRAMVDVIAAFFGMVGLGLLFAPFMGLFETFFPLILTFGFLGSGLVLAVTALMGKTPNIPLVSAQVRYWA